MTTPMSTSYRWTIVGIIAVVVAVVVASVLLVARDATGPAPLQIDPVRIEPVRMLDDDNDAALRAIGVLRDRIPKTPVFRAVSEEN
jgi:hypothetical protein